MSGDKTEAAVNMAASTVVVDTKCVIVLVSRGRTPARAEASVRDAHRSVGTARLRRIRKCLPEGKPTVRVNDLLELPYCADSGAYKSCISREDLEKLNGTEIETFRLRQSITCDLVGGQSLEVKETVYLTLLLRTTAGPVNIHSPVEYLVVEGHDEFLLGRDVLSMLGIDVDRQIELFAWSDGADDDDIEDDPAISREDEDEIREAVEAMIARALDEGFPSDRVEKLRTVIYMYEIWRVKLGDDPPAKVPPLKLCLKPGAKPCKAKARKYPP